MPSPKTAWQDPAGPGRLHNIPTYGGRDQLMLCKTYRTWTWLLPVGLNVTSGRGRMGDWVWHPKQRLTALPIVEFCPASCKAFCRNGMSSLKHFKQDPTFDFGNRFVVHSAHRDREKGYTVVHREWHPCPPSITLLVLAAGLTNPQRFTTADRRNRAPP